MDKKKLLIGGSIALVVIGLIIGVIFYLRKSTPTSQLVIDSPSRPEPVPNPGNSYAPGQSTPVGRIPRKPNLEDLKSVTWKGGNGKGITVNHSIKSFNPETLEVRIFEGDHWKGEVISPTMINWVRNNGERDIWVSDKPFY